MKPAPALSTLAASLLPISTTALASTPNPDHLFTNPDPLLTSAASLQRIPTSYESAVLGRRILALTPLATLSTVFPSTPAASDHDGVDTLERRPPGLAGVPVGLMDCRESLSCHIISFLPSFSRQLLRHLADD